ncbi:MAG: hypothetical protein OXU23_12125, partial [Candidatus Poribacteria bacterium]|nr:hypothetical protein [Candidatus Poribacteria bacterium]
MNHAEYQKRILPKAFPGVPSYNVLGRSDLLGRDLEVAPTKKSGLQTRSIMCVSYKHLRAHE